MYFFHRIIIIILFLALCSQAQTIRVGAKHFNEGYLLAEILAQLFEDDGHRVDRNFNLGGTLICFQALINNEIDIYPEYSGTISQQILKSDKKLSLTEIHAELKRKFNLQISKSLGFNNTYALAVKHRKAKDLGLNRISDLIHFPDLKFVFSYEFLKRKDGWDNLASAYNLKQQPVGIEHGLAYQAIDEATVDLMDVYSTDGEIPRYDLKLLEDDLHFFPEYYALSLFRSDLDPRAKETIEKIDGIISEEIMQNLNARVVFENESHHKVARSFLMEKKLIISDRKSTEPDFWLDIIAKTMVHLEITFIALIAAIMIAIPAGIIIYKHSLLAKPILYLTGLLQTIPSIALLAFMIPFFGIGIVPAIAALFLYALLPILRNTAASLFSIDPLLKKVATGIGLTPWQRLRYVEIPLAIPTIFAGIKTAAVINIGTATLAAFIGAGGLGEFIVTGLALNDTGMIMKGAIPAALLAIIVEFVFELIERMFVPKHLQQKMAK